MALVILWVAVRIIDHLDLLRRPALAMIAGALTLIVLVITGYYGGELVYRERERGDVLPVVPVGVGSPRAHGWVITQAFE